MSVLVRAGAVLVASAMLLAGCGAPAPPGDAARIDAEFVADLAPGDARAVSEAVNAFAFDLFGEVADGRQNTITAPLSMTVLLAMLLAGADGDTGAEMAKVLLNAVYFLGEWTTRFDPGDTRPEPFTLPGGATADLRMMHQSDEMFGYAQRDGYRMLRLPCGEDGRYGMEIMLPDEGNTLTGLLASLDAARWRAAVDSLIEQTIDELALPRFELRWKAN